jgi:hypothetical protein
MQNSTDYANFGEFIARYAITLTASNRPPETLLYSC